MRVRLALEGRDGDRNCLIRRALHPLDARHGHTSTSTEDNSLANRDAAPTDKDDSDDEWFFR
jgi:hypothetical protein